MSRAVDTRRRVPGPAASPCSLRRRTFTASSTSAPAVLRSTPLSCATTSASSAGGGKSNPSVTKRCRVLRSEEHTSELQSRQYLVCRLLLVKKKNKHTLGA